MLPDGAGLVLTGTYVVDRDGRFHADGIVPDVATPPDQAEARAAEWLATQCPAAARKGLDAIRARG